MERVRNPKQLTTTHLEEEDAWEDLTSDGMKP
jgi:hypothetical protein